MTAKLRLTKRQLSLLQMDVLDVGLVPKTQKLGDELMRGNVVTIDETLINELREFADRDDDPREHRVYRQLLHKARAAIKAAGG